MFISRWSFYTEWKLTEGLFTLTCDWWVGDSYLIYFTTYLTYAEKSKREGLDRIGCVEMNWWTYIFMCIFHHGSPKEQSWRQKLNCIFSPDSMVCYVPTDLRLWWRECEVGCDRAIIKTKNSMPQLTFPSITKTQLQRHRHENTCTYLLNCWRVVIECENANQGLFYCLIGIFS